MRRTFRPLSLGLFVNDAVAFATDADLFVREATWTFRSDRLSTTYDAGGATIDVVLER